MTCVYIYEYIYTHIFFKSLKWQIIYNSNKRSHCLTPTCALALRPCTEEQCWDPQRQVKLQIQENTFTLRTQCVTTPPLMNSIGMQLEMKLIPGILIEHSSSTQVLYLLLKSVLLLPNRDHSTPTALQLPMLLHTCQAIFHIWLGGIPVHAPVALPTLPLSAVYRGQFCWNLFIVMNRFSLTPGNWLNQWSRGHHYHLALPKQWKARLSSRLSSRFDTKKKVSLSEFQNTSYSPDKT